MSRDPVLDFTRGVLGLLRGGRRAPRKTLPIHLQIPDGIFRKKLRSNISSLGSAGKYRSVDSVINRISRAYDGKLEDFYEDLLSFILQNKETAAQELWHSAERFAVTKVKITREEQDSIALKLILKPSVRDTTVELLTMLREKRIAQLVNATPTRFWAVVDAYRVRYKTNKNLVDDTFNTLLVDTFSEAGFQQSELTPEYFPSNDAIEAAINILFSSAEIFFNSLSLLVLKSRGEDTGMINLDSASFIAIPFNEAKSRELAPIAFLLMKICRKVVKFTDRSVL